MRTTGYQEKFTGKEMFGPLTMTIWLMVQRNLNFIMELVRVNPFRFHTRSTHAGKGRKVAFHVNT